MMIIVIFRFGSGTSGSVPGRFGDAGLWRWKPVGIFEYADRRRVPERNLCSLSISPYITASIVVQLLAVAIPALEQMAKEGAEGRKRLNKISRYVTIGLALIQSFGYYQLLNRRGAVVDGKCFWQLPAGYHHHSDVHRRFYDLCVVGRTDR